MLRSNEIRAAMGELAAQAGVRVNGVTVVAMRDDIAQFSRDQDDSLPYILGVMPGTRINGKDDGFTYDDSLEIFVAHRIVSGLSVEDRLDKLDDCCEVVKRIVPYIQIQISNYQGFWRDVELGNASISPADIEQMRGYIVVLKYRKRI